MLNFTLKQLRYVESAGRLGSITAAAQELNISQSSITAAIDALEGSLGYDLFVRTPAKGLSTTPTGRESLELVRHFIDQARHFEAEVSSVSGDAKGSVRIACYVTAAPSFLPPILKSLRERFPGLSLQLLEGDMEAVMGYLDNGQADVAFTYDQVAEKRHDFVSLFAAPPYALVAVDHPLSERAHVSLADLGQHPMILLDLPRTPQYFLGMFESQGVTPNVVHTTRSAEMTRALVAGGFGYTILNILPPNYRDGVPAFRAIPIRPEVSTGIEFGIATQKLTRQPRMVSTFIEHCQDLQRSGVFDPMVVV